MFLKMFLSAILGIFAIGACAIPFALDFWGQAPVSLLTEISEPSLNSEGATEIPVSIPNSSESDRLVPPKPTWTLTETVSRIDSSTESSYIPQIGSPAWLTNFAHTELGCNWLGLAGQVLSSDDHPIKNLIIEVGGSLEGSEVIGIGLTGLATDYGSGGYEIVLADHVVNSSRTMWVQIHDITGKDLSNKIFFDTFDDCGRNLILLNFVQARAILREFLPLLNNRP